MNETYMEFSVVRDARSCWKNNVRMKRLLTFAPKFSKPVQKGHKMTPKKLVGPCEIVTPAESAAVKAT